MVDDLLSNKVEVKVNEPNQHGILMTIFITWFPMLLLIGVWIFFMRQMQGGGGGRGAMSFGKSKARMLGEDQVKSPLPMWPVWKRPRKRSASWSSSCAIPASSRSWVARFPAAC